MHKCLAGYLATAVVTVARDILWLGAIAPSMCQRAIGHQMADQPRLLVALAFYALYPVALLIFAILSQANDLAWGKALRMGALLGFFAHATCGLSNLAPLRDWPIRRSLMDMAWGRLLSAASAWAGKAAMNQFTKASPKPPFGA